ncbi:MAG TPA: transcription-repair coupling factor [candidate division Zixibacteria bacterium]|nr:transcription-repair coupling factor [candidate division Zixibacteria bacterium]
MTTTASRPRPASATRGGADRRLSVLAEGLAASLPPPGEIQVPAAARAAHLAARRAVLPAGVPLVVVVRTDDEAHRLADDLSAWQAAGTLRVLPERAAMPLERALPEHDESAERLSVLAELGSGTRSLVLVAPLQALVQRTLGVEQLAASRVHLRVGQRAGQRALLTALVAGGYEPVVEVSGIGEFANRGGIVDVWPPGSPDPIRVELFGDEAESIRTFDPMTQASRRRVEEAVLLPASEFLPADGWESLRERAPWDLSEQLAEDLAKLEQGDLAEAAETWAALLTAGPAADHIPDDAHLVLTDGSELRAIAHELDAQAVQRRAGLREAGELPADWPLPYDADGTLRTLEGRAAERLEEGAEVDAGYRPAPALPGRSERLAPWLAELTAGGRRIVVTTDQASRVGELLEEAGITAGAAAELREVPAPGGIGLVHGSLSGGFVHEPSALVVLTDRELFGATRVRRLTPSKRVVTRDLIGKLSPGDLVVHVDHGIARFAGMTQRTYGGDTREYLQLDFAGDDKIFLPADQIGRITRYSGGSAPALSKLGGTDWERTKRRVRRAVADLADELLEIYAARESAPGFRFSPDTVWQRELEDAFPYTETPDQARTIEEVKADMMRRRPMDRLVCGDVGYGKTEVALRAAFKAVQDGKQVAVLVPTTVLAQQHLGTFTRRLAPFPVRVEMLSRFVPKKKQAEIVAGVADGSVDILIGTHRMLSRDVTFADLGLLVVDEEQRFGVAHKERIKAMRREVDVLTLSATPIPRTLHLSLVGIRDLSVIETPPEARLPIQTRIAEDDDGLIRDAINRELDRGGQVYFVHNRVDTIEAAAERVRRLVPRARVAIGHGQMPEGMLERVMLDFDAGTFDVLVCTTIIESGLDIPNANTIIISRADTFGLAQLYQLRGRVGRSDRRAYAYLLHRRGQPLSPVARKRLHAIFSASDLGAGYQIALSDLEIRGAGNILGPEQHGFMAAVGFELYTRMLAEAVEVRRGRAVGAEPAPVRLDLPGSAYLPDSYIGDAGAKLEIYRRFAHVRSDADAEALREELRDRFGPIPEPVEGLFRAVAVRMAAEAARVPEVRAEARQVVFKWPRFDRRRVSMALQLAGFRPSVGSNQVRIPVGVGRDPVEVALRALAALTAADEAVPTPA